MPPAQKERQDATGLELRRVRNRELELKRITGEISCAECRRLKLKCDKKVPCSSCVRRGCQQICPTGTSTGNSSRQNQIALSVASTSTSHSSEASRKLTAMSERIRALEDALQIQTEGSHPLLSSEHLTIKQGIDVFDRSAQENEDTNTEDDLAGAFGTLSVSEGKGVRFLGASATDSVLLMEVLHSATPLELDPSTLSREIQQASTMWPFAPSYLSRRDHLAQVISQLPRYERVSSLLEAYFSNLAWFIAPIDRAQVMDEILPFFYPRRRPVSPMVVDDEHMHDLALLFAILTCGAVADLTQPALNPEAERLHQLTRAALSLHSFIEYGSLAACQSLFLMGAYEVYSGRKTSQESSWKLMAIGTNIAASIGLHREPSRWKLDPKIVNRRRRAFWEINTLDKWRSLGSGRPISFPASAIDCEFPLDCGATVEEDGSVTESVWNWRYRFTRDVLSFLTDKICAARPPKYSDIMEMDRKVRDFDIHPHVVHNPRANYVFATDGEHRNLHPAVTVWWKEMMLLHIHRNCFARAIIEYPQSPMQCPFCPSFLAAYRSATALLRLIGRAIDRVALILHRLWAIWATALSCAVIVGSVACRPSTVNFAATALNELEKAIVLFEKGKEHPIARHAVPLLYKLRDKANAAFFARGSQSPPSSTNTAESDERGSEQLQISRLPREMAELENNNETLHILRGTTRYIEQRHVPSQRTVEGSHSWADLTFDPSPRHSSNSGGSSRSSNMPTSPGASSVFNGTNATCFNGTRCSIFESSIGMESLLAPSPFVQSPPNSEGRSDVNGLRTPSASSESPDYVHCNFLPPFEDSTSGSCAASKSAQSGGQHSQPSHAHASGSRNAGPPMSLPLSGTPDSSSRSGFSVTNSYGASNCGDTTGTGIPLDHFMANDDSSANMFPPFDFSPENVGMEHPFFSGPMPEAQEMADLNALYEKESGGGTAAWESFMQQFELSNATSFP